jgi:thiol-disulfide isomerase/thioredoxin
MAKSKKNARQIYIVVALILAVAAAVIGTALMSSGSKTTTTKNYEPPTTPIVSTSVKDSLESFKGKVVILDFWATWCGPCRMEIPGFVSLQKRYRGQGLEVVGVSIDPITPQGNGAGVGPFMQKFNINYTILMVNSPSATAGYDYTRGIPTTYLLDRAGRIAKSYVGAQSEAVFEQDLKQLL